MNDSCNPLPQGKFTPSHKMIGGLSLLLFVAFFVGIFLDYGVFNDYIVFSYHNERCCLENPESQHLFRIGRPLGAILLNIQLMPIDEISDFKWMRLFCFILLLGLFVATYLRFRKETEHRDTEALLTAFCIAILPAPILYVFWINDLVPGLLNVLLATLAYTLVYRGYIAGKTRYWIAGYALLFITFFIYPPTSYFFLLFGCWRVLMTEKVGERTWLLRTIWEFVAVGLLSFLYFIYLKLTSTDSFLGLFFDHVRPPFLAYDTALGHDVVRMFLVAKGYLARSVELWFQGWLFDYQLLLGLVLGIIFIISLVSGALVNKTGGGTMLFRVGFPLASLALASAPMVLSAGGFNATRNLYVGSAIVAIILLTSIVNIAVNMGKRGFGYGILWLLSLVALVTGGYRFTVAAFNSHLEADYLRKILSRQSEISSITIHLPPPFGAIVESVPASDFRARALLLGEAFPGSIDGLPRGILKELGFDYRHIPLHYLRCVTKGNIHIDEVFAAPAGSAELEGAIEICMNGVGFVENNNGCFNRPFDIGSRMTGTRITVQRLLPASPYKLDCAFDGSVADVDSHWETRIPVSFDIDYKDHRVMTAYTFQAGPALTDSMPSGWEILGSNDGDDWMAIQSQADTEPWKPSEKRTYSFSKAHSSYRFYRVKFVQSGHPEIMRIYEMDFLSAPDSRDTGAR